jgi:hypothetical protein
MTEHKEVIECLECGTRQWATVKHTEPFWTWIHTCVGCKAIIQESEWVLCWTEEEMKLREWENDKE